MPRRTIPKQTTPERFEALARLADALDDLGLVRTSAERDAAKPAAARHAAWAARVEAAQARWATANRRRSRETEALCEIADLWDDRVLRERSRFQVSLAAFIDCWGVALGSITFDEFAWRAAELRGERGKKYKERKWAYEDEARRVLASRRITPGGKAMRLYSLVAEGIDALIPTEGARRGRGISRAARDGETSARSLSAAAEKFVRRSIEQK
jgi:hypothetical protein